MESRRPLRTLGADSPGFQVHLVNRQECARGPLSPTAWESPALRPRAAAGTAFGATTRGFPCEVVSEHVDKVKTGESTPIPDQASRSDTEALILDRMAALQETDWSKAFARLDPYGGPNVAEQFSSLLAGQVIPVLNPLLEALPTGSVEHGLRVIWACMRKRPLELAMIVNAARACPECSWARVVDHLVTIAPPVGSDSLTTQVLSISQGQGWPPDLGQAKALKPGLRLRYRLAHYRLEGADADLLLRIAVEQPNASQLLRERELRRALVPIEGRIPEPLDLYRLSQLEPKARDFIAKRDWLWRVVTDASLGSVADSVGLVEQVREEVAHARYVAARIPGDLKALRFGRVNAALSRLHWTDLSRRLWLDVKPALPFGFPDEPPMPTRRYGPTRQGTWTPLVPASVTRLRELWPEHKVPKHWTLTASSIAQKLATREMSVDTLSPSERKLVAKTWTIQDEKVIFDSGLSDIVRVDSGFWETLTIQELVSTIEGRPRGWRQILRRRLQSLPDAREWLSLMATDPQSATVLRDLAASVLASGDKRSQRSAWLHWVASAMGSREWWTVEDVAAWGGGFWSVAIDYWRSQGTPVDPSGFRLLLGQEFRKLQPKSHRTLQKRWSEWFLADRDTALKGLTELNREARRAFVRNRDTSLEALRALAPPPDDAERPVWLGIFLMRTPLMSDVRDLLLEQASASGPIPWSDAWLEGKWDADRLEAVILAARRKPAILAAVAEQVKPRQFQRATRRVLKRLPLALYRDRGFLNLIQDLAAPEIKVVGRALKMTNAQSPHGHKLDQAYRRYELPKRSGGTRTISVPHPILKAAQRIVLQRFLLPAGQHPNARGFVRGCSIVDNARPHVGQRIVVNADVRNCFPSVRWQLVLGALRRTLGDRLSAAAISHLTDLCTAEGGLPIGAPTSPALLNLVLWRSDAVLTEEAQRRGCQYTRYADDLTFSGDHGAVEMLGVCKRTLGQIGLELDPRKTNIFRRGRRQMTTGLVVNERVSVPRRIRRRLRAAVHRVEQGAVPHWHDVDQSRSALMGRLAFVQMVHPETGKALRERLLAATAKWPEPADTPMPAEQSEGDPDDGR